MISAAPRELQIAGAGNLTGWPEPMEALSPFGHTFVFSGSLQVQSSAGDVIKGQCRVDLARFLRKLR